MMKILILHDKSGCTFWRAWLPCKMIQKLGLAEVRFLETRELSTEEMAEHIKWCDILYGRGVIGVEGLSLIRNYQRLGKKVVIDYDDLHFNVSPFNPAYKFFGTEEVDVKDPKTGDIVKLWQDGRGDFDIKRNKVKFHSYKAILEEADLITTTTLYLKEAQAQISGRTDNIAVLPNAVNLNVWQPIDCRDKFPQKFRFGWSVSSSHGEDWFFIKPVLDTFLKNHPDATFVCLGDTHMDITAVLPKGQVEWYPFSDLWEGHYALRMPLLGLDCAIAPLADTEFNKCKSPLKFAEYTAFGWPVIAQNMLPYSECMISGHNGLLADTHESWLSALESMYNDTNLRSKCHFNAMFTVKEFFDLEKVALDWAKAFKDILGME